MDVNYMINKHFYRKKNSALVHVSKRNHFADLSVKMNMHEYRRKTLNRDVNRNAHLGFMLALSTRRTSFEHR